MIQYTVNSEDEDILRQVKQEANIKLASVFKQYGKDSNEYDMCKINMHNIVETASCIGSNCKTLDQFETLFVNLNKIKGCGVLSPLTLKDDEFEYVDKTVQVNKRFPHIYKVPSGRIGIESPMFSIVNHRAYYLTVKNYYNHNTNKQMENSSNVVVVGHNKVYITKGGVVTTEYIHNCVIRPEIVSRQYFIVRDAINLQVSAIIHNGESIYCIDSRDPKLKVLRAFYEVPVNIDDTVKGVYNIRSYEKIPK